MLFLRGKVQKEYESHWPGYNVGCHCLRFDCDYNVCVRIYVSRIPRLSSLWHFLLLRMSTPKGQENFDEWGRNTHCHIFICMVGYFDREMNARPIKDEQLIQPYLLPTQP